MTTLDVAVRGRFVNQFGPGARAAKNDLDGVGKSAKNLERSTFGARMAGQLNQVSQAAKSLDRVSFGARMVGQMNQVSQAARRLRQSIREIDGQRLATVASGFTAAVATMRRSLAAPAAADADFKDVVVDIAQKAEIGKDKVGALSDEIKAMADRLRSSPLAIGKGIDVLMGSGLDLDVSKRLVGPIQKVAKAYRVETDEVSKAVFSMVNNLKVAPEDVEVALGRIAQAAADGRYEVKDFAAGLPEIASTMQKFNQTGLKGVSRVAALVETVAGRAGVPGQATGWSEQMLDKALSPDVVKNFKKKGIKIDDRIRKAMKKGDDVNEVIYAAMMEATKGDATKLIDLYGDEQARNAASALMLDIKRYRELRDKYDKITAPEKLNSDFDMRTEGSGSKFRTFGERWLAFQESVGQGVNIFLAPAVEWMGKLLDMVTRLSEAFPNLTGSVTLFGAALAAFGAYKTAVGVIGGLAARLGVGGATAAGATGAGVGAGGAAASGAGAGAAAAAAGRAGFLARMMPILGRAGGVGLGVAVAAGIIQGLNAFKTREWTVKDRGDGESRLEELRSRLAELDAKIAGIETKSKAPEMAETLTLPLKTEKSQVEAEIKFIEEELNRLGSLKPQPQIDTTSIDAAIARVRALKGELQGVGTGAPSLMGNVPTPNPRPAPPTAPRGGRGAASGAAGGANVRQSSVIHQHIYGGDAARVARLAQREQERTIRSARAGSLHDVGSWS